MSTLRDPILCACQANNRHFACVNSLCTWHAASWQQHTVLAIKPRCLACRDEELAAIGVGPSIGHRQHALGMLDGEVLVSELAAVDALHRRVDRVEAAVRVACAMKHALSCNCTARATHT